jgi:hypothetical protein
MSYVEDLKAIDRWDKIGTFCTVVGFALYAVSLWQKDIDGLHFAMITAFGFAALAGFFEARAKKTAGQDPDATYLRAIINALIGVILFL